MRQWFQRATWWQLGLVQGAYFAIVMFVVFSVLDPTTGVAARAMGCVAGGAIFGLLMGPSIAWVRRRGRRSR